MIHGERPKLVNDNHDAGKTLAGEVEIVVCISRTDSSEFGFAGFQEGLQGLQGSRGEARLEICQHPVDVREALELPKRCPTFVINQDKTQVSRRILQSEPQEPSRQELGLPSSGGPRDQGVWPFGNEVEYPRRSFYGETQGCGEADRGGVPAAGDGLRGDFPE